MVRNALAFVGGVLIVHRLPELPAAWPSSVAMALLLVVAWRTRHGWLCAIACGFAWAWVHAAARLANDLPEALAGIDLAMSGCVAALPERTGQALRFAFDVDGAAPGVPPFVELTWYEPGAPLRPGDCLDLTVRLRARRGFANPGGFDYEAQLLAQGIGATGYVRELQRAVPASEPWRYPLAVARAGLGDRIDAVLRTHPMRGVIKGLAVGDRQQLGDAQWRTLAATGTSHLMAISGLHIGIVAGLAAWLGRRCAGLRRAQRWRLTGQDAAAVAALVAALTYAALAGFAVPTQRALVMLAVYLVARLARRNVAAGVTLAWAAVAVVLVDPFAPLAAGAWLSFGAVAAILWGMSGRPVRASQAGAFVRMQGYVTVGLLPVLALAFGQVSLVSPLANLFAIPLFSLLVVPLVLAGTLLLAISPTIGAPVLGAAALVLDCTWPVLDWLADWRFATVHVAQPDRVALIVLGVLALLAVAPAPWPLRAIALAGSFMMLGRAPQPPPPATVEVTVLDVGQGLAVAVRTHGHVLLYDTGPAFRTGRDTGHLVVLPYLRALGVRRLDRLIASHGDFDHVGGLVTVLTGMPVDQVVAGPSVPTPRDDTLACARGETWTWDAVEFRFLHPPATPSTATRDNDASCVLEVAVGAQRVLLTGDIEAAAEQELVQSGLLRRVTVLTAPHHGSRTSSSPAFVAATRPALVVFSSGYRNRWGFPLPDVVQRWRDAGAATMATADAGAVTLRLDGRGIASIERHRLEQRRYWRR